MAFSRSNGGKDFPAAAPSRRNGFKCHIEGAKRCVRGGKGKSGEMPLTATLANMKTMDQIRAQIGLKYSFE